MILAALALTGCRASSEAPAVDAWPGTMVHQPTGTPTAAAVLLHGSEGGQRSRMPELAGQLAEQGIVAAAFCWFDCDGLPSAVHRISLDRTADFLKWFRAGPAEGLPVVVYGASRGAEHALLLASLLGDTELIDGVAAHAGSDTVVSSYDPATRAAIPSEGGWDAAWTWRGEPLYGERAMPYGSGPRIEIERYPGPVWLSHGEADPLWPAERTRRLAASRGSLPTETHVWPGEGHVISAENLESYLASLTAFVEKRAGDE